MTPERNDPTASGFTPPDSGVVRLSGNETEMLCLKAARGAGMAWGLAEEAGYAARWLQSRGIDGATALLAHLQWMDGRAWDSVRPEAPDRFRPPAAGRLCPIAVGVTLSDAGTLPDSAIGPVAQPVLVLPFLHLLARADGGTVAVTWQGGQVTVTPEGEVGGRAAQLATLEEATLGLARADRPASMPALDQRPPAAVLARLNGYAMKITVPASGSSRVDAGAASGDND